MDLSKEELTDMYNQVNGDHEKLGELLGRTSRTAYMLTLKYGIRDSKKPVPRETEKQCTICNQIFYYKRSKKVCSEKCSTELKRKHSHVRWHKNRNITKTIVLFV